MARCFNWICLSLVSDGATVNADAVAPTVTVQNQIVAVPLKTNVTLECLVESSPKSVYFWYKDGRHQMRNRIVSTAGGSLTLRSCRP